MIWYTKFFTDNNFAWYLTVVEVNTVLALGHLQNGGNIMTTLTFRSQLAIHCMENTIGTYAGDIGRPVCTTRRPQIFKFHLEKVSNYF